MQQAFDSQDATAFLEAAETLRASSANIGARRLAELCAETHKTVQLRGLAAAQDQMNRTLAEYNRVRAGLEQLSKKATH
jgi:HPt (histidine-containing phosphotransfer) domain-containing protein